MYSFHRAFGSRKLAIRAASLALVASCVLIRADRAQAVECAVRASKSEHNLRLEAVVLAEAALSGDYKLFVNKASASGASQNAQSGAFDLQTGGEKVLSAVTLDREPGGDYSAELSLTWKNGQTSCHYP